MALINVFVGNDDQGPTISAQTPGATENVQQSVSGVISVTDNIAQGGVGDTGVSSIVLKSQPYFGSISLSPASVNGNALQTTFTFTPNANIEQLAQGQSFYSYFLVEATDARGNVSNQYVAVALAGSNDAPEFRSVDADGIANAANAFKDAGNIYFADVDQIDTHAVAVTRLSSSADPRIGTLKASIPVDSNTTTLGSEGRVRWVYEASQAAQDSLKSGQIFTEQFDIALRDNSGAIIHQTVTVVVAGNLNNAPELSTLSPIVFNDTAADDDFMGLASQQIRQANASDLDGDKVTFGLAGSTATTIGGMNARVVNTTYGDFYVTTKDGLYAFVPKDAEIEALITPNQLLTFTITANDGAATSSRQVQVVLNGANDTAVITGKNAGSVTEDDANLNTATGTLTVADRDANQSGFQAVAPSSLNGTYGTFAFNTTSGKWTYTLDNSRAVTQAINAGQSQTDTLVVKSTDGLTSETITVTVNGAADNNAPILDPLSLINFTDTAADDNFFDQAVQQIRQASATDPNPGDTISYGVVGGVAGNYFGFQGQRVDTAYGTLYVTKNDGYYAFVPDDAAVEALTNTTALALYFFITATDNAGNSTNGQLMVNLKGVQDTAAITGTSTGVVTEDTASQTTANGSLVVTDRDSGESVFQVPASLNGIYGTFTFNANTGAWGYTLDNSRVATQALLGGASDFDTLQVKSKDGSATQDIVVTVNGKADASIPAVNNANNDPNNNNNFAATMLGTANADTYAGTINADSYNGKDGNDDISLGGGADTGYGGTGNDTLDGGSNNDVLYGGSGNDTLLGDTGNDTLYGGSGGDIINGESGNDVIVGGYGADNLTGGSGIDTFVYLDVKDTGDVIQDFLAGTDKLDFSAIDADITANGKQAFVFNATADTLQAHSVVALKQGGNTVVLLDTDGDVNTAELQVVLVGNINLTAGDFIL